jgi:hypothetical protein
MQDFVDMNYVGVNVLQDPSHLSDQNVSIMQYTRRALPKSSGIEQSLFFLLGPN